jgi:serine/threonine-protein kinase
MESFETTLVSPASKVYLSPGAELGNYRVVSFLAEGGMGQVYVAEHPQLGRRAAVKILRPDLSGNADAVRRFFQEAKLVNSIRSEHIVDIFDMGQDREGRVYYVMELLEGATLAAARERDGAFGVARVIEISGQVAAALNAAHEKDVIHRDLKPENVFLCKREGKGDLVKLLDFGLAKLVEEAPTGSSTRLGVVLGTPEFMSPEQAAGAKVDGRSDIYSFGLLLYWMLSDGLPFDAQGVLQTMRARQSTAPKPLPGESSSGDQVPAWLATLVMKCLVTEPSARVQSMQEVLRAFQLPTGRLGLAGPRTSPAPGATPRSGRRLRLAGAVGFTLLTALGLGLWLGVRKAPEAEPPLQAPPPPPTLALPAPPPEAVAIPAPAVVPAEAKPSPAPSPAVRHPKRPARSAVDKPAAPKAPGGDADELVVPANMGN